MLIQKLLSRNDLKISHVVLIQSFLTENIYCFNGTWAQIEIAPLN